MGHRLRLHEGKCRNYHGHNYTITVTVYGEPAHETGMIMDFADLKAVIRAVLLPYDHAMVLEDNDAMLALLREGSFKYVITEFPPTAENLARHWKARITDHLSWQADLVVVRVEEMPDSGATA
jgi:6-pyruvoyltetrahydropterin/6-carboxytetrahydropterin synthase